MRSVVLCSVAVVAAISAGLAQVTPPGPHPSSFAPCTVEGVSTQTLCGEITVPEDRTRRTGRQIPLHVVLVKAPPPADPDPILFFAGGPGQGAAMLAASVLPDLLTIAPTRDIILIDQRGTGRSGLLTCEGGFRILEDTHAADLQKCAETLSTAADLDQYGSEDSADDGADVAKALGYRQVNVVGVSYGTRLAQYFAARHSPMVRTLVLRAMAPPGYNILSDGGRHAKAALQQVVNDCARDMACHAAYPKLGDDIVALREQLRRNPDPMSLDTLDLTLYALLLAAPSRQTIPFIVHAAANGDTTRLVATARTLETVYDAVAVGEYLSVVCAEDAPRASAADIRSIEGAFNGSIEAVVAACRNWPVRAAPRPPRNPPAQPTLVISGELDPATPASMVDAALRGRRNVQHIVLPNTAHGPTFPGCTGQLVKTFIDSAGRGRLTTECVKSLTLPPFRLPS